MDWITLGIMAAFVAVYFGLKRMSFVSELVARKLLAEGALVVDVRSPEEFAGGAVPGAVNIPLGELEEQAPTLARNREQPLLVHCLSGGRSAIARHQLKRMGYSSVHNLGSLSRARKIAGSGGRFPAG